MYEEQNFCFPVKVLENDRLKLVPFDTKFHAEPFYTAVAPHPELWQHMPSGPLSSVDDFVHNLIEKKIQPDPGVVLFAIFAKADTKGRDGWMLEGEELAGIVGYLNTSRAEATSEIGWITIAPTWQRTFVATNAVGLLLLYALDAPSQGGLGLRRIQWQANSLNEPSINLAKRMRFTFEGIARWQRTMPVEKAGNGVDPLELERAERFVDGGRAQRPGRHSAVLSMCWDDWLVDGKRAMVKDLMIRRK